MQEWRQGMYNPENVRFVNEDASTRNRTGRVLIRSLNDDDDTTYNRFSPRVGARCGKISLLYEWKSSVRLFVRLSACGEKQREYPNHDIESSSVLSRTQ